MSSSQKLNEIVDDKLYTRMLLGKAGVGYPVTLAFPYKATRVYENEDLDLIIVPIHFDISDPAAKNLVRKEINKFIMKNKDASFNKVGI